MEVAAAFVTGWKIGIACAAAICFIWGGLDYAKRQDEFKFIREW